MHLSADLDQINIEITSTVISAAESSIPSSKGTSTKKMVPWWTEECHQAVRGQVWGMIKRMGGDRRDWEYPVMVDEGKTTVTGKEKQK